MKVNINKRSEQGWEALANAIIAQAASDMVCYLKFIMKDGDREYKINHSEYATFFRSEYFTMLSDMDGQYIFKQLVKGVWDSDDERIFKSGK